MTYELKHSSLSMWVARLSAAHIDGVSNEEFSEFVTAFHELIDSRIDLFCHLSALVDQDLAYAGEDVSGIERSDVLRARKALERWSK